MFLVNCTSFSKKCVLVASLFVLVTASCMVHPASSAKVNSSEPCPILCTGEILKEVQLSRIFNSSIYFVHMNLLSTPVRIQAEFDKLKNESQDLAPSVLRSFVDKWFGPPGSDLETAEPTDWTAKPRFIEFVYDKQLREWLWELNEIWKGLLRRTPEVVKDNAQAYSQVYLPNPFVVPGGRFTEIYYWDSYWIIEGLLLCEMQDTARHMIENLVYLVNEYGYVPNGSRKFYLGRSQIPFLISIMTMYERYTDDQDFLDLNIDVMKTEFDYWLDNYSVSFDLDGMNYTLFHYMTNSTEPRPESYINDYMDFQNSSTKETKHFYADIRAAAESGWDFSTRWFVNENGRSDDIEDIYTQIILPVDLNSVMCYNAKILSDIFDRIGDYKLAKRYGKFANDLNHTISRLFWDEDEGFWFDFNLKTKTLEKDFYASSFMPLWTKTYGSERNQSHMISKVVSYIEGENLSSHPGGLPTSLRNSGQQWDYPNGWAPLNYIAIFGLRDAAVYNATAGDIAEDLAKKWVLNNYYSYINSSPHLMYEKYDVSCVGVPGSGGEYPVQAGFGWTNGVVMALLNAYPHKILTRHGFDYPSLVLAVVLILVMIVTLAQFAYTNCSVSALTKKPKPDKIKPDFNESLLQELYIE